MAKHNNVTLYGYVPELPVIVKDDKTNEYIRGIFTAVVVRGIRDFGNNIDRIKYDAVRVMSFNPDIIKVIETLKVHDMVEVKGSFTTRDVVKAVFCDECNTKISTQGSLAYINPIYMSKRETGASAEDCVKLLKKRYEISNQATLIGIVCREPEFFRTTKGVVITTYQLAVFRKYRVRNDAVDDIVDFPWVKSYGKIAISDYKALKKGSFVFIDGIVQARDIERKSVCPECGAIRTWNELVEEIIPYAVEYLKDYNTKEDVLKLEAEGVKAIKKTIFSESLIERSSEEVDIDIGKLAEEEKNSLYE